jgi:hypothetical protein
MREDESRRRSRAISGAEQWGVTGGHPVASDAAGGAGPAGKGTKRELPECNEDMAQLCRLA